MKEQYYVVRDTNGEYISDNYEGQRTPVNDEAKKFGTRKEAEAACERVTDCVLVRALSN